MAGVSRAAKKKRIVLQKANQMKKEAAAARKLMKVKISNIAKCSVGTQTEFEKAATGCQTDLKGSTATENQNEKPDSIDGPCLPIKQPAVISKQDVGLQVTPKTRRKIGTVTKRCQEDGRRIVSFSSLNDAIQNISRHSSMCGKGHVEFNFERKVGINIQITFSCGCGKQFTISGNGRNVTLDVNDALLWGSTVSASGYQSTSQFLSIMDIPVASYNLYNKIQGYVHKDLMIAAAENMKTWAQKKAELAVADGQIVTLRINGKTAQYPAITVIVDGGWTKRSYNHSFASNCGVAVIIGARTRKVIYADTRITTCAVCDRKRETTTIPNHLCFKNWDKSPNGMESDIITSGFKSSIDMYGLVYRKFVGDGDSSVHFNVENAYPGIKVEKVECRNHVVKNFTKRLMEISKDAVKGMVIPLEERKIFNPVLPRFRTALTQAITYNHNAKLNWEALYDDIKNMPYHIFGQHDKCKPYFCSGKKDKELNIVGVVSKMMFWKALNKAIDKPASLASSLIQKESSNNAECFMSVACKFVEGKRKNFGQRYLYRLRMAGAIFSYNDCGFWGTEAYKRLKHKQPTLLWQQNSTNSMKQRKRLRKYQLKRPLKVPKLGPASFDYGENPQSPDLPDSVVKKKIEELKSSLSVSQEEATTIEEKTRSQSLSDEWFTQRSKRITASKAGQIYKLRDSTDNKNILNEYFGRKKYAGLAEAMEFGRIKEDGAIKVYEQAMKLPSGSVEKVGLVVSIENGIFGASPDGYVGAEGMIEVKCPYCLHMKDTNKQGPSAWPEVSKSSSLQILDGKLELNKNHVHYYQCVMQLYVTGRHWCDYFVWSEFGYYVERIVRSPETDILWKKMKVKLEKFWEEDIAPELVDSRFDRGYNEYKCPPSRLAARVKKAASKKK